VWHVFPGGGFSQKRAGLFPATLRTWDQTMWLRRVDSSQSAWQAAPLLPLGCFFLRMPREQGQIILAWLKSTLESSACLSEIHRGDLLAIGHKIGGSALGEKLVLVEQKL
jgi:hypothetical protein